MEKLPVRNKMLFKREEFLWRKRSDQLYMVWKGHKLKISGQYYADVERVNFSIGVY